ncbi:protein KTI12 homolog [Tiliqua scincoides]|uniref:protein KTI12 homolog n=1 Tax=Tiliqua scincoides TaxID=71010 RepID=UPI003461B150
MQLVKLLGKSFPLVLWHRLRSAPFQENKGQPPASLRVPEPYRRRSARGRPPRPPHSARHVLQRPPRLLAPPRKAGPFCGDGLLPSLVAMPLVVLCGLPGSGKSRRAEELREALGAEEGGERRVFVVAEAAAAGGGRAALRAEAERLLSRRDVVVVDAGNELKSFRYELYCLSKHAGTPHCLVLCPGGAPRPDRSPLEAPDPRQRWDWPLFTAPADEAEPLPLAEIRAALFERRPPPPNQSTRSQPLQAAGFLHRLDRLTQDVLAALMAAQRGGVQPGQFVPVAVDGLRGEAQGLVLSRPVSLAELSRLRRQFLSYAKMHPGDGEENLPQLGSMFLQYLSRNLH